MAVSPIPIAQSGERPLSFREQIQKAGAASCAASRGPHCDFQVHVGVFFDGTNNNRQRDQLDVSNPNARSHSNVVVLYDTYKDKPEEGFYRIYVPGVGTPFPEIGELTETPDGKAKATGGDARINWALLEMLNAMHRTILRERLVPAEQLKDLVHAQPLHYGSNPGSNIEGKRAYFCGEGIASDGGLLAKLERGLKRRPPKRLSLVSVSVFGFSRGAAQARAFCHFIHNIMLKADGGGYTLAGVPFRLQFLGLFDSVASVGLADSSPTHRGLGGWASGTLDIAPSVERCVHLCAAHEIRLNFPLSTARTGTRYPLNCIEKVYPGAHSDVGGGYDPGCQGKASESRSKLLSQMPLLDMYREAQVSAVPLLSIAQLKQAAKGGETVADLQINEESAKYFNAYREWAAGVAAPTVEETLHGHMKLYWLWRLRCIGRTDTLESYKQASSQDRQDVMESDGDFMTDMAKALEKQRAHIARPHHEPSFAQAERDFVQVNATYLQSGSSVVPPLVGRFFDLMVHDSHASFYMVGPVTAYDREQKIKEIQARLRAAQERLQQMRADPRQATRMQGVASDAMLSLNDLERRILDHQRHHPGEFPILTDADRDQLLAMEDMTTSGAVRLVTRKTRRELGGHVRYRRVFDKS
ncbi:DUF2235 domain-containing protein [Variovorax sp. KBW07]|uniref:T6SS phospholipase effector Tle1-like catalytic domain-containing protein n=1 Tax=Variovorax sp. KBW07 TaxID=2153358 RepID=UPI000F5852AB|nr:DUF2235 domain-containing protein [Variovorax sp. KBW07]RQO50979.1 DUF2235 domain-containing protein [Variovorax sp. KBW07]